MKFGSRLKIIFQDLSHNSLTSLPTGMGYLVRLTELNISHNKLTELPPDIVSMRGNYINYNISTKYLA